MVVARGQTELERAGADADTTVFVARTAALAESTTETLAEVASTRRTARARRPRPQRAALPRPRRRPSPKRVGRPRTSSRPSAVPPTCAPARRCRAARSSTGPASPTRPASPTTGTPSTSLSRAADPARRRSSSAARRAFTNDQITEGSNAAIALRMLGHSGRVVWYVPSREDVPAGDDAGLALTAPAVARPGPGARRRGLRRARALARTPVRPARVRAPARRRPCGGDHGEPRTALPAGPRRLPGRGHPPARHPDPARRLPRPAPTHRHDLVPRGRPGPGRARSPPRRGRRVDEVGALLLGPPPTRDDHLLGLAAELAALEKEVRRS